MSSFNQQRASVDGMEYKVVQVQQGCGGTVRIALQTAHSENIFRVTGALTDSKHQAHYR